MDSQRRSPRIHHLLYHKPLGLTIERPCHAKAPLNSPHKLELCPPYVLITYRNNRAWSILSIKWQPSYRWAAATAVVLLAAIFVSFVTGDTSPFLYFQF